MSGSDASRGARELPCVWSLAGVLGPRPCHRGYDCDSCELFYALSGRSAPPDCAGVRPPVLSERERALEAEVGRIVSRLMCGCRLNLDRWYGSDGLWVDPEVGDDLAVGLVDCVWRVLQPVRDVVPPRLGVSLERGDTCGWLVRRERSIPLRLPAAGRVTDVNEALVVRVRETGCVDGHDDWLCRLQPACDPAAEGSLMRGEEALVWHLRKLRTLKGFLRDALESGTPGEVGLVLADGGQPTADLERILGPERFGELLDHLF